MDATGRSFFVTFAQLCREWIQDCALLALPTTKDTSLAKALELVRADPAGCQLNAAVAVAGLSERTFRRRCKLTIGMGWDEYRRRARLLSAIDALVETNRSISRIAADVGFESQSAFAHAFRHLTGQTPRAFREQSRR
jgi:transcriptional regulator GlxA family with amidase domain